MAELRPPVIEVDANIEGQQVTGRFEFPSPPDDEATLQGEGRTGYLVQGAGDQLYSILTDAQGNAGEANRKGFAQDFGGGEFTLTFSTMLHEGGVLPDGSSYQWGSSASNGLSETSATGQSGYEQAQLFLNYWRYSSIDSQTPARLTFGEWHPDGVFDPLDVVFEQPSIDLAVGDAGFARVTVTCIETATLDAVVDGASQTLQ